MDSVFRSLQASVCQQCWACLSLSHLKALNQGQLEDLKATIFIVSGTHQAGLKLGDQEGAGPVEGEGDGGAQRLALRREQLHVEGPGQRAKAC